MILRAFFAPLLVVGTALAISTSEINQAVADKFSAV
jgi:hypothetical protein